MSKGISTSLRCNEQIRISPIRLIGAANEQIGVIDTYQALQMAREQGLDLVEVAPTERPPVCRIMDYGKFKYNQKKNLKKHHEQQIKEVRLRPRTDEHDRQIKVRNAIRFLAKGDKVQFTMQFRGRERAHREIGTQIFRGIADSINEYVKIERPPLMDGRNMVMIVSPVKAAIEKAVADGKLAFLAKAVEVEAPDTDTDDEGGEPTPAAAAQS